jgi:MscS family membrane protein
MRAIAALSALQPSPLPDFLMRGGPFGLLWWQWCALLIVLFAGWLIGVVLGRITIRLLTRLTARTAARWDDLLVAKKRGPVILLWAIAAWWLLLPAIELSPRATGTIGTLLRLTLYVALLWAAARAADVLATNATTSDWARKNPASRSLIPFASRLLKIGVLAIAVVSLLAQLGYPVASLIAGFGIGGLALALAAQKTIENLFGALSLAVDRPLCEGDLVRVDDRVGTVETIGLRSTRIRSPARTLITIPNGKVAEMTIESLAARDRILFECRIGLVYETSVDQLRRVLHDLERILRKHEDIWPESIDVHFVGYGASSLDVEVMAWFQTTDFSRFLALRQEILLEFMQAIAAAGSAFALPAQTLHVAPGPRPRGERAPREAQPKSKDRNPPS